MFARLAGALKRKKDATKFEVTLRIHSLSPWPGTAKFKRLAVKWQRGDKRSGTTKPVLGADDPTARAPGKGFHLKFAFNDTVTFPVTLYKESEGSSSYAKKTLTLTVLESADVSGRNPTEVGTLVLNLAEFASTEGRTDELRKVVKASGAITTVVGDPFLAFSISVTWNKNAAPGGAASSVASDSAEDDDDDDEKSKPAVPAPAAQRPTLAGRARPPPPPFAEDADAETAKKKPGAAKKPAPVSEEEEEDNSDSGSEAKFPAKAPPAASKTITIPAKKPAAAAPPPAAAAKKSAVPGLPKKQVYDSDGFLVDEDEDEDDSPPPAAKEAPPAAKGKAVKPVERSFESQRRGELFGKTPAGAMPAAAKGGAAGEPEDPNRAALFSTDTSMLFQKKAPGAAGAPGGAKLALGRTGSGTSLGGAAAAAKKPAAAPAAPPGKGAAKAAAADDSDEESPPAAAANGKTSGSAAWDDGSIASSDEDAPKPAAPKAGVSARSAGGGAQPKGALKKRAGDDDDSDAEPAAKPAAKKGPAAPLGGGATKRVAFAAQSSEGEEDEEEPAAPTFSSGMFSKKAAPQPAAKAAKPSRGSDEGEEEESDEPDTPVTSDEEEEGPPARKPAVVIPSRSGSGAAKAAEEERKRKEAEAAAAEAAKAEAERKRLEDEAKAEAARQEAEAAAEAKAKAERKAAKKAKAAKEAEAAAAPAEPAAKPAVSGSARTNGSARTGNGAVAPAAVETSAPAAPVAPSAADGALRGELVDCAALDLALRTGPASPCGARGPVHGPARGCVHALRCAAPGPGVAALCHRMMGAFATSLLSCGGAGQALFWWSNIAALRAAVSLRAVWEPADAPPQALLTWLQGTCVRLEGAACAKAAAAAWDAAVSPACRRAPPPPGRGHSVDDALAGHWVGALDGAEAALMAGATEPSQLGTFPGLAATALSQVLARLDAALFNALLRPGDGALGDAVTVKAAIPGGGGVTFSSGVAIKLTVERLTGWASARKVVAPGAAHFPLLKAAADVLMMPKGALLDTSVRADVAGSLSPVLLRALLARFTPDEASPEAVPPVLLTALETQAKQQMSKEQRKAAKSPAAVAVLPPYAAPDAASLGVDWLDWDGFPLNEDGLAAVADPLRALLGGDPTQPPPGAPPALDARFGALRESWGV